VHLVGFIIGIYHDARSRELQIRRETSNFVGRITNKLTSK